MTSKTKEKKTDEKGYKRVFDSTVDWPSIGRPLIRIVN